MNFFVSDRQYFPKGKKKENDFEIRPTNSYIELEIPIDEESSIFIYIIPKNQHSAFVAVCLDDMFEKIMDDLDEDTLEIIVDTWPTFAELLYNGIKDKYQNGALIQLEDDDYGEKKWFVASVAGNISFENVEELFGERTAKAIGVVMNRTSELLSELQEKKPSTWTAIKKGFISGLKIGVLESISQMFNSN
jgi:hypothetical protein